MRRRLVQYFLYSHAVRLVLGAKNSGGISENKGFWRFIDAKGGRASMALRVRDNSIVHTDTGVNGSEVQADRDQRRRRHGAQDSVQFELHFIKNGNFALTMTRRY